LLKGFFTSHKFIARFDINRLKPDSGICGFVFYPVFFANLCRSSHAKIINIHIMGTPFLASAIKRLGLLFALPAILIISCNKGGQK
jgi:hypothetical protein